MYISTKQKICLPSCFLLFFAQKALRLSGSHNKIEKKEEYSLKSSLIINLPNLIVKAYKQAHPQLFTYPCQATSKERQYPF